MTQTQTKARKNRVSEINYDLFLDLTGGSQTFSGRVVIDLHLKSLKQPLAIDFYQGEVTHLVINEKVVEPNYNRYALIIHPELLNQGHNTIEISFNQHYNQEGKGLHRFIDPEDQRVYLYSDFEPDYAHRVFPLLDQPDLKATFKLSTRAPQSWQVISTKRERQVVRDGETRWWYFPASEKISSYVFAIHAGSYHVWEDQNFHVPLRLMARQSQKHNVDYVSLFKITRQGIEFYEQYLDTPYPFSKYDQLIVPDFTYAGMEMAAATILNEDILLEPINSIKYPLQSHYVAQLVLHELAHMWFGNLVTMTWWDDLWLNEGFADFFTWMAMDESIGMPDDWLFSNHYGVVPKQHAYRMDELPSAHPVKFPAKTPDEAIILMDSITYDKGASVLQQLRKMLGAEVFRQGIREYLHQHREGNTRLPDFIHTMEQVSGVPLDQWTTDFLTTSGVNELQAEFSCQKGMLDSLHLIQYPALAGEKKRRAQTVNIALLMVNNEQLVTSRNLTATYKGKKTKIALTGRHRCPAAVMPNSDDQAYVMVRLDEQSQAASHQYPVADPIIRQLIVSGRLRDLRAGRIAFFSYAQTILSLYGNEKDPLIQSDLEEQIEGIYYLTQTLKPDNKKVQKQLAELADTIESFSWQQFDLNMDEKSQRWFDIWVNVAHSPEALEHITLYLEDKRTNTHFAVQQYQRWNLLRQLSIFSVPGTDERVQQELKRDKSSDAYSNALAIQAAAPSIDNKRYWLNRLLDSNNDLTPAETNEVTHNLFSISQIDQWRFMAQEVINGLAIIKQPSSDSQEVYTHMLANECSQSGLNRLDHAIEIYPQSDLLMTEALQSTRQKTSDCIRMTEKIDR